ncbi:MvdC/MvdD family ATP grasp protein [Clostridium perfringens]|nr:hypothetical protein [Clostridium perfringens]
MKKILIITSSVDYTVDYIIRKYNKKYIFYRVNIDMFDRYEFNVSYDNGFSISNKRWNIKESEIDAIYYRKPMLPDLTCYEECYRKMISQDIISYVNGFVDSFNGKVLSKPSILRKSENKVYQMKLAREVGFKFPMSSIGTNVLEINSIIMKGAVIKPLTTGKIINEDTCELIQTSMIENCIDEEISLTPLYLQEYINKSYEVRVTIINKKVFGVKIDAYNRVDWRIQQNKNKYSVIDIPKEIKAKCFKIMDLMNLEFGAFDFIVDNNKFIFLEINPNGQWLWLEKELGLNISKEIMHYLGRD